MKRFFQILVLLFAVSISSAFAQTSQEKFNVQFPREGFPVNVQKISGNIPESLVLFMAIDLENKVAPADVEVEIRGSNLNDKFKFSSKGAQRYYSASQLSGDLEVTVTKAGYKIIKEKIKVDGPAVVAIRLDKVDTAQHKTYKVGDYYNDATKEGVVFYVDATGKHGKIVSMRESKSSKWAAVVSEQNRSIGASNRVNGSNNMSAVKSRPNWRVNYPAFAWCANLGTGWYLPSIGELELLLLNDSIHDAVNRALKSRAASPLVSIGEPQFYWSSTENVTGQGFYTAWCIIMTSGVVDGEFFKEYPGYVRAIATF